MARIIVGIDEVGRGPLAGPVTVGVVAFFVKHSKGVNNILRGIKDSKKLSSQQREDWLKKIKLESRLYVAVASVSHKTIDRLGIVRATTRAVDVSIRRLNVQLLPHIQASNFRILLDGSLYAPLLYTNQETITKGDEKVPIIAAASIVAKVHRDNTMRRFHTKLPLYRFDLHKGYGTKLHCKLIHKYGLSSIHRKTFCRNIY